MDTIADKKKAILESTLALINENGFHGTPMSLVAKKAGVAAGTIYHYFESKETLIRELHGYIKEQIVAAILKGDNESADFRERLFNFWLNHYTYYINHPASLHFMEQFVNSPFNTCEALTEHERFKNVISRLVDCGIKNGILKQLDRKLIGLIIHGSIISAAKTNLAGKIKIGKKEEKQLFEIVWDGIRKH